MTRIDRKELMERILEAVEDDELVGFCIKCGDEYDGLLEPDARKVKCQRCGELAVYGAEELLIMGAA
jgi:hypothetical protein